MLTVDEGVVIGLVNIGEVVRGAVVMGVVVGAVVGFNKVPLAE